MLAKLIDDCCKQWSREWKVQEGIDQGGSLHPRGQWREEVKRHGEEAIMKYAALEKESVHLAARWKTVQTQLTAAEEEIRVTTAQHVEQGLMVARAVAQLEGNKARAQEEAALIAQG